MRIVLFVVGIILLVFAAISAIGILWSYDSKLVWVALLASSLSLALLVFWAERVIGLLQDQVSALASQYTRLKALEKLATAQVEQSRVTNMILTKHLNRTIEQSDAAVSAPVENSKHGSQQVKKTGFSADE